MNNNYFPAAQAKPHYSSFPGSHDPRILTDTEQQVCVIPESLIPRMKRYDWTIPTGVWAGKRWLSRNRDGNMRMGEMFELDESPRTGVLGIHWFSVLIAEGC